jgi:hypothetical protein
MFHPPLIAYLLGARFNILYQHAQVVPGLVFLLSSNLYMKENLGHFGWIKNFIPPCQANNSFGDSPIHATLRWKAKLNLQIFNVIETVISFRLLQCKHHVFPFLV